jgi:hypothetical protein
MASSLVESGYDVAVLRRPSIPDLLSPAEAGRHSRHFQ